MFNGNSFKYNTDIIQSTTVNKVLYIHAAILIISSKIYTKFVINI